MKIVQQRANPKLKPSFQLFSKKGKLNFYSWAELGPWMLSGWGAVGLSREMGRPCEERDLPLCLS